MQTGANEPIAGPARVKDGGGASIPSRFLPRLGAEAVLLIVLVGATVAAYWPVTTHPFIVLDDLPYVVSNPHITHLNWETVKWSFTAFRGANWFPLTWLSHALDYRLFSLRAGRHHDMNLLLHVFNALLLFWVLWQATGYMARSWMVAALFALHPLNVESVAWVAERKNLLSMCFFLLALGAYYTYARKPRVSSYLAVATLFALGLMCKPQIITLPFVLLLWDYWPLERSASRVSPLALRQNASDAFSGEERRANGSWRFLLLEKLPLLALSIASAIVTIKAQRSGGTMNGAVNSFSLASRLGNAILSYVRYLGYAVWPARLAFFYPHARTGPPAWQLLAAGAFLVLVTWLALRSREHRYLAVGWLWFLGTLVPMIGVVQVGGQAMADRYTYLPMIGVFFALVWGVADGVGRWSSARIWLPAVVITVLVALGLATRRQVDFWSDGLTLWEHTAEITSNNGFAQNMIGENMLRNGDQEGSLLHFRAAAAMQPLDPFPRLHIGIYEEEHGHPHEALQDLQTVLDLTQPFAAYTPTIRSSAFVYMSFAYNQLGDYADQQKYMAMAAQLQK